MKAAIIGIVVVVLVVLVGQSIYVVPPTEQVILTQFGKPIGEPVVEPGLKFKIPFIQKENRLDNRILIWDGNSTPMQTRDKLFIQVDLFARWEIEDPLLFFQRLRGNRTASSRLDDILAGETLKSIASHDLADVIRTTKDRELEEGADAITDLEEITVGRAKIEEQILKQARTEVEKLGINLLDIRFKRINYRDQLVIDSIYERMASERRQIAEQIRAEGDEEASRILGQMDLELKQIESEAYKTVQEIRGDADAQATEIYAKAYNQSPEAAEFYGFLKTTELYPDLFRGNSTIVLSTDSDLFDLLKGIDAESRRAKPAPAPSQDNGSELPLFLRDQ